MSPDLRCGWILTCDTTTAVQSFCETICDRCDWHLTETQPQSQLHSKRCWLIDAVALFRFCHFQFYSGTLVSLLGTCGEQVMCCQNGYAILAQAVPPAIQYFRKPTHHCPTFRIWRRCLMYWMPHLMWFLSNIRIRWICFTNKSWPSSSPRRFHTSSWQGWRQMATARWRTLPIDGPPSRRPGTTLQQISSSVTQTVGELWSHKRRRTTWPCASHNVSVKPSSCWALGAWARAEWDPQDYYRRHHRRRPRWMPSVIDASS